MQSNSESGDTAADFEMFLAEVLAEDDGDNILNDESLFSVGPVANFCSLKNLFGYTPVLH